MSTLAEIEAATEALPEREKEQLFLFLAARLRAANPTELPLPRKFSGGQMEEWIRDDEEGVRRLSDAVALESAQLLDQMEAGNGER